MTAANNRIAFIDGWRAVAVLMVITAHVTRHWWGLPYPFDYGTIGVYIFFLLSGYIIAALALREISHSGEFNQRNFIIRRALRILPPLLLYALVILVFVNHDTDYLLAALRALTFNCNVALGTGCGWDFGHTWSLAFEEQFYLIFPTLITLSFTPMLLPGLVLLVLAYVFPVEFVGRTGLTQILMLFALGMLYARYRASVDTFLARLPLPLIVLAAIYPFYWTTLPSESVMTAVAGLLLPPAVFLLVFGLPRIRLLNRLLTSRLMGLIGLYSYSIYLVQQVFTREHEGWGALEFTTSLVAIFLIAKLSYDYYEVIFRRLSARYR